MALLVVLVAAIVVAPDGLFRQLRIGETSPDAVARMGAASGERGSEPPPRDVVRYGAGLAPTPPMGWNGYNRFSRGVTDRIVRAMARALITSGMKARGYNYVNLDGGWDLKDRSADGQLQPDPKKFPHGIKPLADYVHALGLKFGIYTSAGYMNCANTSAGSYGYYDQDAKLFASWDVDYVKLDWCYMPVHDFPHVMRLVMTEVLAKAFGDAILATGRPMVLDLNATWNDPTSPDWAPVLGNVWRTSGDIADTYDSMLSNFVTEVRHYDTAGPDHWNDPDMLEVGNPGMTYDEQRAHFSLWAELAAPLIAGNDLTRMSRNTLGILTNQAVIAVDQDPLGAQGRPVMNLDGLWVLTKPLQNGDRAVVMFNSNDWPAEMSASVTEIGLSGASDYQVTDLWTGTVTTTDSTISAFVAEHSAVMYVVSPMALTGRTT